MKKPTWKERPIATGIDAGIQPPTVPLNVTVRATPDLQPILDAVASRPEETAELVKATPLAREELREVFEVAVYRGRLEIVEMLLERGVESAPLYSSQWAAKPESAIEWVVNESPKWAASDIPNLPPRPDGQVIYRETRANRFGGPLLVILLQHLDRPKREALLTTNGTQFLKFAVWDAYDAGLVRYLCANGVDPNTGDIGGNSFLNAALQLGQYALVTALVENGAIVHEQDLALAQTLDDAWNQANPQDAIPERNRINRSFVELLQSNRPD